jgi:2-polyprenyl-6-hydroxyphenyl methylase/3-demethylubiquinone-9 3-methyltransferase
MHHREESQLTADGINASLTDVLRLYGGASMGTRAFLRGRVLLSDLEFIESQTPAAGRIIDLGCGHGLFSNLLAMRSGRRHVTGIDLDCKKIEIAQQTVGARGNIEFRCGDMLELGLSGCDAVTIVDVMYLLPPEKQIAIIEKCSQVLVPGGLLVWKAQETRPRWKYGLTYAQELVTTSIGLTQGKHAAKLYFLERQEALEALGSAGFKARAIGMTSWRPYTDVLYLAEKIAD